MSERLGFVTRRRLLEWLAIVAGFVTVHFVGRPTSLVGWLILLPAGALVVTPVVLAAQREYLREREESTAVTAAADYCRRLGNTLGDMVIPFADLIEQIAVARGTGRVRLQAQLMQGIVTGGLGHHGTDGARASLYLLVDDTFTEAAWAGHSHAPPLPFTGDAAARLRQISRHDGRLLIDDVGAEDLPLRLHADSEFHCLAIALVAAGERHLGLLVVHAPEPASLTPDDLDLLVTLAHLLGAGLATWHPRHLTTAAVPAACPPAANAAEGSQAA